MVDINRDIFKVNTDNAIEDILTGKNATDTQSGLASESINEQLIEKLQWNEGIEALDRLRSGNITTLNRLPVGEPITLENLTRVDTDIEPVTNNLGLGDYLMNPVYGMLGSISASFKDWSVEIDPFNRASLPYMANEQRLAYELTEKLYYNLSPADRIRVNDTATQYEYLDGVPPTAFGWLGLKPSQRKALVEVYNDIHKTDGATYDMAYNSMVEAYQEDATGWKYLSEVFADISEATKPPERYAPQDFIGDVLSGVGQAGTNVALLAAPWGWPAKIAAGVKMYSEMAGYEYEAAIQNGATPENALKAARINGVINGAIEYLADSVMAIPFGKSLKAIRTGVAGGARKRLLGYTAQGAMGEFAAETTQQFIQEAATIYSLNPDISPVELASQTFTPKTIGEAIYAGTVGAVTGGLISGAGHLPAVAYEYIGNRISEKQAKEDKAKIAEFTRIKTKEINGEQLTEEESKTLDNIKQVFTERAQQAIISYQSNDADPIKQDMLGALTTIYGKQKAPLVMELYDTMALAWSSITGKAPGRFFTEEFTGIFSQKEIDFLREHDPETYRRLNLTDKAVGEMLTENEQAIRAEALRRAEEDPYYKTLKMLSGPNTSKFSPRMVKNFAGVQMTEYNKAGRKVYTPEFREILKRFTHQKGKLNEKEIEASGYSDWRDFFQEVMQRKERTYKEVLKVHEQKVADEWGGEFAEADRQMLNQGRQSTSPAQYNAAMGITEASTGMLQADNAVVTAPNETAQTYNDEIPFIRKSDTTGLPLGKSAINGVIDNIVSQWVNANREAVVLVDGFDALPSELKDKLASQGYNPDADNNPGFNYKGKIYLFQNKLTSDLLVEESLLHEYLHLAVRSKGKELLPFLRELQEKIGDIEAIRTLGEQYGLNLSLYDEQASRLPEHLRPLLYVEELIAGVEGKKVYKSLPQNILNAIKEFWGKFRDWLRVNGFNRIAETIGMNLDNFTQSDLAWTLKGVKDGFTETQSDNDVRFIISAYHGTPHTFAAEEGAPMGRFREPQVGTGEGSAAYGWAVAYSAGNKETAKTYANRLSENRGDVFINGEKINQLADTPESIVAARLASRYRAEMSLGNTKYSLNELINDTKRDIENAILTAKMSGKGGLKFFEHVLAQKYALERMVKENLEVKNAGNLYHVEILANDEDMLDWDKPLSEQSEKVREAINAMLSDTEFISSLNMENITRPDFIKGIKGYTDEDFENEYINKGYSFKNGKMFTPTGKEISDISRKNQFIMNAGKANYRDAGHMYRDLAHMLGSDKAASKELYIFGIKGVKYADAGSRGTEGGTSNYTVFDEKDIRITGRNGEMLPSEALREQNAQDKDLMSPDKSILYQTQQQALQPFYSQLERVITAKMPDNATPAQVMGIINKNAVKQDEIKWSGIEQALKDIAVNGKVSKEAVLEYLKDEGNARFEEVKLAGKEVVPDLKERERNYSEDGSSVEITIEDADSGDYFYITHEIDAGNVTVQGPGGQFLDVDAPLNNQKLSDGITAIKNWLKNRVKAAGVSGPAQFAYYVLPGGTNYREVVLVMPNSNQPMSFEEWGRSVFGSSFNPQSQLQRDQYEERLRGGTLFEEAYKYISNSYYSSHFPDVPNYVAHMRLDDRVDTEGREGAFIEEVQSDRHQQGRKEGYIGDKVPLTVHEYEGRFYVITLDGRRTDFATREQAIDFARVGDVSKKGIPRAPFEKTWPLQMFKRALRDAIADGKDWIGWTTGETQSDRYDLSKHIDRISWTKNSTGTYDILIEPKGESAAGTVSRGDLTEGKLSDWVGKELAEKIITGPPSGKLKGLDLKVGGEGMKGFYDTILPKEIAAYVKKWGATVESKTIKTKDYKGFGDITIHAVEITPQMRQEIEAVGQALYQEGEEVRQAATLLNPETLEQTIHLFETADVTSIVHETGHVLTRLIAKYDVDGWQRLCGWLGADAAMGFDELGTEQKEKLADAFLVYMMEGTAPSIKTESIFDKMRSWLMTLYQKILSLGVEINDDVRYTFDVWMTTQVEREFDPGWQMKEWMRAESSKDGNIALKDIKGLADLDAKAKANVLKRYGRELKALYRKKIAEFHNEAIKTVDNDPYWKLLDGIIKSGGFNISDTDLTWISARDRNRLKRMGVINPDGNMSLEDVAALGNYPDGNTLIKDIIQHPGDRKYAVMRREKELLSAWERELPNEIKRLSLREEVLKERQDILDKLTGEKGKVSKQVKTELSERALQLELDRLENEMNRQSRNMKELSRRNQRQLELIQQLKDKTIARDERRKNLAAISRIKNYKNLDKEFQNQLGFVLTRYFNVAARIGRQPYSIFESFLEKVCGDGWRSELIYQHYQALPPARSRQTPLTDDGIKTIRQFAEALVKLNDEYRAQNKEESIRDRLELVQSMYESRNKKMEAGDVDAGKIITGEPLNAWDKFKKKINGILSQLANMEALSEMLGDKFRKTFFEPISQAEDRKLSMQTEYGKKLSAILRPYLSKTGWLAKQYNINGNTLTKEHILMIALNAGNKGNLNHLMKGNRVSQESLDACIDVLKTEGEYQLVDDIFKLLGEFFPMLEDVHYKTTGTKLTKVSGNYFPVYINFTEARQNKILTEDKIKALYEKMNQPYSQYIQLNPAHSQREERVGGAYPLRLDINVIFQHMNKCINDICFTEPIRDIRKVINSAEVGGAIEDLLGSEYLKTMHEWLNDIAAPYKYLNQFDRICDWLRNRTNIAVMAFKFGTAAVQPLALNNTVEKYGFAKTMSMVTEFYANYTNLTAMINEKSGYMRGRTAYMDNDIYLAMEQSRNIKKSDKLRKLQETYYVMISFMDKQACYPTWMLAYREAQAKGLSEDESVSEADKAVRETQGTGRLSDLCALQRKQGLWRCMTMFYTFFNRLFNTLWQRFDATFNTKQMTYLEFARSVAWLMVIPAYLGTFIAKGFELPEDEEWLTSPLLFGAGTMPIIRDVTYSGVKYATGKSYSMDYRFIPIEEPIKAMSKLVFEPFAQFGRWREGKEIKTDKLLWAGYDAAAYAYGLPVQQVHITVNGFLGFINNADSSIADKFIRLALYKPKEKETEVKNVSYRR